MLSSSAPLFPPRPEDAHKGTFGRVVCLCGSHGMAGAAYLAGLAVGFFKSREELKSLAGAAKIFSPEIGEDQRQSALSGWRRAVKACRVFSEEE